MNRKIWNVRNLISQAFYGKIEEKTASKKLLEKKKGVTDQIRKTLIFSTLNEGYNQRKKKYKN